ncbi:MAG: hypothetical protein Q7J98_01600 [Kiritimatiellia bacterium]|nr:hypothetical protein [Kiritimatiellia bacterium]
MNTNEEYFYETAAQEVATKQFVPGLMAKAFSECNGDEKKTIARYIKYRVGQLQEQFAAELTQRRAHELERKKDEERRRRREAEIERARHRAEQERKRRASVQSPPSHPSDPWIPATPAQNAVAWAIVVITVVVGSIIFCMSLIKL